MNNHTAGPWVYEANSYEINIFSDEKPWPIATIKRSALSPNLDDRAKANARLMSLSPEMFEALEAFIAWRDAEHDFKDTTFMDRAAMAVFSEDLARKVVAKLKGRQNEIR
jgi:hypothetical protein